MNKMEEVAKIFGLKLGDPFNVKYIEYEITFEGEFYFDKDGINGPDGREDAMYAFMNILTGRYELIK